MKHHFGLLLVALSGCTQSVDFTDSEGPLEVARTELSPSKDASPSVRSLFAVPGSAMELDALPAPSKPIIASAEPTPEETFAARIRNASSIEIARPYFDQSIPDKDYVVSTRYKLVASEALRGPPLPSFTTPGGTLGNVSTIYYETPQFREGESAMFIFQQYNGVSILTATAAVVGKDLYFAGVLYSDSNVRSWIGGVQ